LGDGALYYRLEGKAMTKERVIPSARALNFVSKWKWIDEFHDLYDIAKLCDAFIAEHVRVLLADDEAAIAALVAEMRMLWQQHDNASIDESFVRAVLAALYRKAAAL
jgi:hypothetical protein